MGRGAEGETPVWVAMYKGLASEEECCVQPRECTKLPAQHHNLARSLDSCHTRQAKERPFGTLPLDPEESMQFEVRPRGRGEIKAK